ncbi:MAG: efflux transporter outer membrane subunit [Verrucomicrobiota bacterium]
MRFPKFILAAPLLAACSVGPDFQRPGNRLPASWSMGQRHATAAADPAALAGWWRRFHDPQLNRLVGQAVTVNLDIQQAAARLAQARAQRQAAASSFWPWLSASGSEQESHVGGSGPAAGHARSYQGGFSAAWELDVFGGNRRNLESANARLAAAASDLDATRLSMAAEVALTYCQLRAIQDQLAVARRNLDTQQHSAKITRDRRGAGFASDLDVANSSALVANTQAQIPSLETAATQSAHAIAVLLNRPPNELISLLADPRAVPTAAASVPTGIPSDLLRRRPDLLRAEANAHAATANIGVAVADLFPKFSLTGSLTQQSAKLSDWLSPSARVGSFGPSFNWALFQGGNLQANIRIQQALRDESVLAYRKTVLVALQEVEDSLAASANEHRRHASLAEAVTANRRAVELSLQLYTAGQTEFINVLNAQRSLYQSETEFTLSNLALAGDLIALYKALGGGW